MFNMSFEVRSFYSSVIFARRGRGGGQESGTKPIPHNLSFKNIRLLSGGWRGAGHESGIFYSKYVRQWMNSQRALLDVYNDMIKTNSHGFIRILSSQYVYSYKYQDVKNQHQRFETRPFQNGVCEMSKLNLVLMQSLRLIKMEVDAVARQPRYSQIVR